MEGVPLGVFPLFVRSVGVLGVLLTGLGLGPASESPMAAKRDRFGEGGGRLHAATDQYSGGLARARKIRHTKRQPSSAWSPTLSVRCRAFVSYKPLYGKAFRGLTEGETRFLGELCCELTSDSSAEALQYSEY